MANYSTNFTGTENPISEGGVWVGASLPTFPGISAPYADMQKGNLVTQGCYGTQDPNNQNDSTSLLQGAGAGTWTTNQTVTATVIINAGTPANQELELQTNGIITAGSPGELKWYEYSFEIDGVVSIIMVNVHTQTFTFVLVATNIPGGALVTGNQIRGTNVNGLLTAWINRGAGWVNLGSGNDSTYTGGSPGFGAVIGVGQNLSDAGFSAFSAQDDAPTSISLAGTGATSATGTQGPNLTVAL